MRLLIQRVKHGSVTVQSEVVSSIDHGYVVLVGVGHGDSEKQAAWLAQKVTGLRIFEDDEGRFNRSILDVGGSVLVVSQFTLYASIERGRRPSFIEAAAPEAAEPLVGRFAQLLRDNGIAHVVTGRFGAHMLVTILNDGPVTIWLERS